MRRFRAVALPLLLALPACGWLPSGWSPRGWFHGGWIPFHRGAPEKPAPIDLNTASLRKIESLPGITPSIAKHIVERRPYSTTSDLVERDILTAHELDRIEDSVTLTPPKQ
jgi:hypothetical protein